tara:strand:+ start:239 stop:454 length:216 start_codon:yes stop_codon:yes gene_type:complete
MDLAEAAVEAERIQGHRLETVEMAVKVVLEFLVFLFLEVSHTIILLELVVPVEMLPQYNQELLDKRVKQLH